MGGLGDFGPVLDDVDFNQDGSIKVTGKQNVKFYKKKFLNFKARWKTDEAGKRALDIDPKTGNNTHAAHEN